MSEIREWVKSSYSNGDGGHCVEWAPAVAATTGTVPIRDSKLTDGPELAVPARSWDAFLAHIKPS
ncbi:DUF397 domain-containing protein [Streptomyces sp. SBT349]|uniref:DUF397 domain-containing protein n=1 Tax=Streptomyces sp. SBT349 TaxID=1580539 RepID=UPI00066C505B|nr:DUF397 domain-containing protein [Streptomyces sp. SBT349]